MNISFKALSKEAISALNTEVTGQLELVYHEQLPDVKHREFFNYENDVLSAVKKRAKNNNRYDVFVTKPYTDKRYVNNKYANQYGDCLSIVDRKTKEIVKHIPDAIDKSLSPSQMINNFIFAVKTAEKMAFDAENGFLKKLSNHFKKTVILPMNENSEYKIFDDTINQYETTDSKLLERINAPKSDDLNTEGFDIEENEQNLLNYKLYAKDFNTEKCKHNILQRCLGTPDEKIELNNFLKNVSPELESSNTFTREDYSKLSDEQKKLLRDFVNNDFEYSYSKQSVKSDIQTDAVYINGFTNILKDKLDNKYGENGYIIFGLGSSPACMLQLLKEKSVECVNIPFSKDVLDDGGYSLKDTGETVDWAEYFKSFSLSPEDIEKYKKDNKKVIILDYCDSGKTQDIFEYLLKDRAKIQKSDYIFEDLGELCWDKNSYTSDIFINQFLEFRKGKLYSTCQNAGNTRDFYENVKEYEKEYKWHPLTKLFYFACYDNAAEMDKKFNAILERDPKKY